MNDKLSGIHCSDCGYKFVYADLVSSPNWEAHFCDHKKGPDYIPRDSYGEELKMNATMLIIDDSAGQVILGNFSEGSK